MNRVRESAILGGFLLLAFVLGGWVLGGQIKALKLGDRYVTVRGLAERNVKSDLAIWSLTVSASGDDYATVLQAASDAKGKTLAFLAAQGITPGETTSGAPSVTDKQAREYGGNEKGPRYLVNQQIVVTSPRVDAINVATNRVADLLQQGVLLSANRVQFKFSSLNSVKPDMISEATRNAREAAGRFASDSGSRVGSIRQASQGQFSIAAPNDTGTADPNMYGGGDAADSSIMKKIRVVTSVDYYLEK
jgi:uncharacterized protein